MGENGEVDFGTTYSGEDRFYEFDILKTPLGRGAGRLAQRPVRDPDESGEHHPVGLMDFAFRLVASDGAARSGELTTPHGTVPTPAFMPVGTQATVKGLAPETVRATGADILLGNTYHLMLRPGAERIAAFGGLHPFMHWPHAILTDSGGFQVMSLAGLRKIEERCVIFRSHLDGANVELSPERAVEIQGLLGSDIAMQLDECVKLPAPRAELERAMQLSLRWAERSQARVRGAAPEGARLVRHRAGRRRSGAAGGQRTRPDRYRVRGLRHRRPRGRRIAGGHAGDDRRDRAGAARRSAPLSDGRRNAGGHPRSDRARHRHVRLRDADAQRPARRGLHPLRRRSFSRTRATPTIHVRWTKKVRFPPRATIRGPICIIWSRATRCWAPCSCPRSISPIISN